MKINYILLEDEYYTAEAMKLLMHREHPDYRLIGVADDLHGASCLLRQPDVQLVISDVCLSDGTIFDALNSFDIPVIFITGYEQYREMTRRYNTVDFLLKPVDETSLESALKKFENRLLNV